jgi:hypothetical protein
MLLFDCLQGQSRPVVGHEMETPISPDDGITRFLILSASYLRLSLEALTRSSLNKSKINHSPRSSHD